MIKNEKIRETVKSILIVLLSVSAVFLVVNLQPFASIGREKIGSLLRPSYDSDLSAAIDETGAAAAAYPYAVAVVGENGRYGVQYDEEEINEVYLRINTYFGEALGSATNCSEVDTEEWEKALQEQSVYVCFYSEVPLSSFAIWNGAEMSQAIEDMFVKRLLLSNNEDNGVLYYMSDDGIYKSDTAVKYSSVLQSLEEIISNGATFAFETDSASAKVEPYVLLQEKDWVFPVLSSGERLQTESEIYSVIDLMGLKSLDTYMEADGTQVLVDNSGTVRVSDDGVLTYRRNQNSDVLRVNSKTMQPTYTEMIGYAAELCELLLEPVSGDADILFDGIEKNEDGQYAVRFGYFVNGVRVDLGEDSWAAEITFSGRYVSAMQLVFKGYQITEVTEELLSQEQVVAAMSALFSEREGFVLCYDDNGKDASAVWKAE